MWYVEGSEWPGTGVIVVIFHFYNIIGRHELKEGRLLISRGIEREEQNIVVGMSEKKLWLTSGSNWSKLI